MSVQVQLRNGRIMDATDNGNDTFDVTLASGEVKTYNMTNLRSVIRKEQQQDVPKEDNMSKKAIYHYLQQVKFAPDALEMVRRIISTRLDPNIAEAYMESYTTKRHVGNAYAIQSGTWQFNMLEALMIHKDLDFRLMVLNNKDIPELPEGKLAEFLKGSTFAYAGPSYTFFLNVYGATVDFGLDDLGISISMAKKSAKRLQELLRMTEMSLYIPEATGEEITISFPNLLGDPKFYDGKSYIRRSLAIRACASITNEKRRATLIRKIKSGKLVHVHFRMMTPAGLFKGDAIVCPNKQIRTDLVTVPDNLKTELTTEDFYMLSMWEHEMVHMAVWDDQSSINFPAALTESDQKGDIARLVRAMRETISSGKLPEWLLMGESAHNDDGTPNMEMLSDTYNKGWVKVQAHNVDVRAIQNFPYMGVGGVIKRMDGEKRRGYYRKMWVPMTNAVLLTYITWESATLMGRFTFPGRNRNECFFDRRVGLVIPGRRMVETYNLHGGDDLDDSRKVKKIRLWCSDSTIIPLHLGKTLAHDEEVPLTADEAVLRAFMVRSPNGPGEYSIERMDWRGFPLPEELEAPVTLVDLAKLPLPQNLLLEKVKMSGLPHSTVYSGKEMTRADAQEMILAQATNPGVGAFCNAIMVWADCMGASFPPVMLDKMEEIVDACQMGFDAAAFAAIKNESDNIYKQTVQHGMTVDAALAATRMPYKYAKGLTKVAGRFARTQKYYAEAIDVMRTELLEHTLEMRSKTDLVKAMAHISCGRDAYTFAEEFYLRNRLALANADEAKKVDLNLYNKELGNRPRNPFAIMSINQAHKETMETIVQNMVDEFSRMPEDVAHRYILGLYKYLVTAPLEMKRYDRIIAQPGKDMDLMDLLLGALIREGLATALPIVADEEEDVDFPDQEDQDQEFDEELID